MWTIRHDVNEYHWTLFGLLGHLGLVGELPVVISMNQNQHVDDGADDKDENGGDHDQKPKRSEVDDELCFYGDLYTLPCPGRTSNEYLVGVLH